MDESQVNPATQDDTTQDPVVAAPEVSEGGVVVDAPETEEQQEGATDEPVM